MSKRDKVFIVSNAAATKRLFQTVTAAKAYAQKYRFHIVEQFKFGETRRDAMVFEGFHYGDFSGKKCKWDFCTQVTQ